MDKTVQEVDVSDKTLFERWQRVKDDFWGDLKQEALRAVQRLLETTMDIELQDMIGARRYEHVASRRSMRNGCYYRGLLTSLGWMGQLRVPRLRTGRVVWKCLKRYKRRSDDVDQGILEMFLAGVSTRRVQEVLHPLMGAQTVSASTVSEISKVLDKAVRGFHRRPLGDIYRYLILDGVYLKAKSPASVKRRCILVAYGLRSDGVRELIDFQLAGGGESQSAWERFLNQLKNRGILGNALHLAVVDGNKGCWNALDLVYPELPRQRCWAHKLRNVANRIPKRLIKSVMIQASQLYSASSYEHAVKRFKTWKKLWKPVIPEAVGCLEQDLESLLVFYKVCPKNLWIKLRTTNIIERIFREVRRRTRPMSCFENTDSVERIVFAIFHRQNNLWKDKPLKKFTQKS